MPIIKQAIKKLRRDRKVTKKNAAIRAGVRVAMKSIRENPVKEEIAKAFSVIDKAKKRHIIHKNKAARLKSLAAKIVARTEKKA